MQAWRSAGVLLLVSGCAAGGEPIDQLGSEASEREDGRTEWIKGGTEATAYPEAVTIDLDGGSSACSGSLIAPQLVLTAGHCAFGFSSFEVNAPYASPPQSASSSNGQTFDWNNTSQSVDPNQHDVGVIFLDQPIDLTNYLQVAQQPLPFGSFGLNIGRIDNGQITSQLFVGPPVALKDGKQVGYPLDYYSTEITEPGDSGGPVVATGGPPYTVVAVNSGGGQGTQISARLDLVYSWLKDQIAASGGNTPPPPQPPPQPPPSGGCDHGLCELGAPLDPNCDPCVKAVCSYDDYCCGAEWDGICVEEAMYICGPVC